MLIQTEPEYSSRAERAVCQAESFRLQIRMHFSCWAGPETGRIWESIRLDVYKRQLLDCAEYYLQIEDFSSEQVLELHIE